MIDGAGGWLTPGLIDCHTHLVFGGRPRGRVRAAPAGRLLRGDRARRRRHRQHGRRDPRGQRRRARGGGAGAPRRAPRRGRDHGRDQVGLRPRPRRPRSGCSRSRARSARPPGSRSAPATSARMRCRASTPRTARAISTWSASGCCRRSRPAASPMRSTRSARGSRFTPDEVARVFAAAQRHGLPVKLHADQLSDLGGAALAARFGALSADHLEYASEAGVAAMAAAGTVAVLLPGAFYTLRETRQPPVEALAPPRRADRDRDRLQPRLVAADLAARGAQPGLHAVPADARGGARRGDPQRRARARARRPRHARGGPARRPRALATSAARRSSATGSGATRSRSYSRTAVVRIPEQ